MVELTISEQVLGSGPLSWAAASLCIWLSYVFAQGLGNMGRWDRHHLIWGLFSIVHFMYYVLVIDRSFQVSRSGVFWVGALCAARGSAVEMVDPAVGSYPVLVYVSCKGFTDCLNL